MAATVVTYIATGAGPTTADAEATGVVFSREDSATGTTAIPKPTATGTNFSWPKTLFLNVTAGGGSTSLSNRKIRVATAPSAGLELHFKDGADTYSQAAAEADVDNTSADGAQPTGYTAMTTTFQTWDAVSAAAVDATRNGNYVVVALGVSSNYAGGAGSGIALPDIELQYDEA